ARRKPRRRSGTRKMHGDPGPRRGARSGRLSVLRFFGNRDCRQAIVFQRSVGQAGLRQEYFRDRRRLSPAAAGRAVRRGRDAAATPGLGGSRRPEKSGLFARDREDDEKEADRARISLTERIWRSTDESGVFRREFVAAGNDHFDRSRIAGNALVVYPGGRSVRKSDDRDDARRVVPGGEGPRDFRG